MPHNVFVLAIIGIVAVTLVTIVSMFAPNEADKGKKKKKKGRDDSSEEVQALTERCQKLSSRIEALETIIIENERNSKSTTHD